jgi:hypothetical protein
MENNDRTTHNDNHTHGKTTRHTKQATNPMDTDTLASTTGNPNNGNPSRLTHEQQMAPPCTHQDPMESETFGRVLGPRGGDL